MGYLLKSVLCLLILLLFHRLVLQQEVLFRFNRFFLIAAVIGSFLIPLVTLEVAEEEAIIAIPSEVYSEDISSIELSKGLAEMPELEVENTKKAEVLIPWLKIGWTVYLIGVMIFLVRFLRNLRSIYQQVQRNHQVIYRRETLVLLPRLVSPFSFLKYIFFSKSSFEKEGMPEAVFLHEQCHVQEKHTWDILLIEVLVVVFWFHPGLYLARQAIRLNHEFIADRQVIQQLSISEYQSVLIAILPSQQGFALGSSLNFSLTKKRFEMMNKSSKPRIKFLKLASLVVFVGINVSIFAEKVVVNAVAQENVETEKVQTANKAKSFSLELFADGRIFLEKQLVSKIQLVNHLSELSGEEIVVVLNADPTLDIGQVAEIQEMLLAHDVHRVYMQKVESNDQEVSFEEKMERHFREAIFLIESTDMEYTQKRYGELKEKEKTLLLFTDKKVEKETPDNQLFEQWKNEKEFAIWIDGRSVANTVLSKYQAKDFVKWFQSGVKANARSVRFPQPFQVYLYSPGYFEESFGPNSDMFRPRTNRDTITITQRKLTSMKDLSRYPDPVTAFLQKNARYEKLKASPEGNSAEVKQKIQQLYEELESEYSKTPDNRKKRLKKPIPPSIAYSEKSVAALSQKKSTF